MTKIPGTNVASTIAPFTTDDQFPTHDAIYGKGGQREVATIAERDAIPTARLTEGCTCYVAATEKTYRWKSNTWVDDTPEIASDASDISYTPSGSGSTQTTVAGALDSLNESVSGLESSVEDNAGDIADLQEGAVAVDVDTTTKVFAIKNAKGQDVGTITVSETTGLPATLTLAKAGTNGQNITISLPTLAYNSQTQMLEYVDATGTHVPTVKLSNFTIKYVGSTDPSTGDWALGDLILVGSNSAYELKVYDGNSTWQPLGSINNVSLQADQVHFSANGFEATDVQGAIEEVKSLISNASIKDIYPDLYPSVLYVVDGDGYIGLKLDVNGLDTASISTHLASLIQDIAGSGGDSEGGDSGGGSVTPSDGSTWLTGKRIVAVGASTCEMGASQTVGWQTVLANRTGAIFNKTLNNQVSKGGQRCLSYTNVGALNDSSDQARLKLLKEKVDNQEAQVDVIFFLNPNDSLHGSFGSLSDTPFFQQQIVYSQSIYNNKTEAENAFSQNGPSIFADVDENKKIGTIGRLKYLKTGSYKSQKLTISGNATNAGVLTIHIGNTDYDVQIASGDSPSDIIDSIFIWDFGDYSVVKVDGENATKFSIDGANSDVTVSVTSNIGVTAVVSDVAAGNELSYKQICFLSRDTSGWNTVSNWGSPSLCACYMGMIEYAINNFPQVRLFVVVQPKFNTPAYKRQASCPYRADGTYDIYNWKLSEKLPDYASMINIEKQVCSLYNIPFIDLQTEANISLYNMHTYYADYVHPNTAGYTRWGETLARLLTGK